MSLFLLDAVLWVFGIRGHIPQNDGSPERPGRIVIRGQHRHADADFGRRHRFDRISVAGPVGGGLARRQAALGLADARQHPGIQGRRRAAIPRRAFGRAEQPLADRGEMTYVMLRRSRKSTGTLLQHKQSGLARGENAGSRSRHPDKGTIRCSPAEPPCSAPPQPPSCWRPPRLPTISTCRASTSIWWRRRLRMRTNRPPRRAPRSWSSNS